MANVVKLGQPALQNILDCSTIGIDNYVGLSVRLPIGLQVITPTVTNNSLLDEFALFFSSALGSQELAHKRQEIENALAFGPLSNLSSHHIRSATRFVAKDFANHFYDDFLQMVMAQLLLEQADVKSIDALMKQLEAEKQQLAAELKKATEEEMKKKEEAEKKKPVGSNVEDKDLLAKLKNIGTCEMGEEWIREDGGFVCSGGAHHISDADLARA